MIISKDYARSAFSEETRTGLRYLAFAMQAEKEGHPQIAALFRDTARARDREKIHNTLYQNALTRLAELTKGDYYVCPGCGSTWERQRPEKCPRCRSEAINLVKVG